VTEDQKAAERPRPIDWSGVPIVTSEAEIQAHALRLYDLAYYISRWADIDPQASQDREAGAWKGLIPETKEQMADDAFEAAAAFERRRATRQARIRDLTRSHE